jgi:hypothetical protein
MQYLIRRAIEKPQFNGNWDGPAWRNANIADIDKFHRAGSDHRPKTQAKLLYDDTGLYAIFRNEDRYVRCTRTENQTLTSKDSCVEVFLQPFENKGYINFEMNCGGAILCYYITDASRSPMQLWKQAEKIPQSLLETIRIYHSMPKTTPVEIKEPVTWTVEYFVPNRFFETYVGPLGDPRSRQWRGNFFKCADESSHPHWASWNAIGEELNFHQPKYFAPIRFE